MQFYFLGFSLTLSNADHFTVPFSAYLFIKKCVYPSVGPCPDISGLHTVYALWRGKVLC